MKKSSSENSPFNKGGRKRASAGATDQAKLKSSPSEKESITSGLQTSEENYDGDSDKETLESVAKRVPSMVSETSKDCSHRDDAVRPCKETAANNEPSSSSLWYGTFLPALVVRNLPPALVVRNLPPALVVRNLPPALVVRNLPPALVVRNLPPALVVRNLPPALVVRNLPPALVVRNLPPALVVRNLPPALVVRNLMLNALTISEA